MMMKVRNNRKNQLKERIRKKARVKEKVRMWKLRVLKLKDCSKRRKLRKLLREKPQLSEPSKLSVIR